MLSVALGNFRNGLVARIQALHILVFFLDTTMGVGKVSISGLVEELVERSELVR